jgi:hypothetical protein
MCLSGEEGVFHPGEVKRRQEKELDRIGALQQRPFIMPLRSR